MRQEEEAVMIVRAELSRRLFALQQLSGTRRPREFSEAVQQMRDIATAYQFLPVVRLAEALERVPLCPESARSIDLFLDRMHDAIACDRRDRRAGEAMLASISVRMAF